MTVDLCSESDDDSKSDEDNGKKKKQKKKKTKKNPELTEEEKEKKRKEEEKAFIRDHQHNGPWGAMSTCVLNNVTFRERFEVHFVYIFY